MRWLAAFIIALSLPLMGSDCEVGPEDNGVDGRPAVLPWDVYISPDLEHPSAVVHAIEMANERFYPMFVFTYQTEACWFEDTANFSPENRVGKILVYEGFAGTPGQMTDEGELLEDPGGLAIRWWDSYGEIAAGDLVISSDIAYDWQTVRDVSAHELGHFLGFVHDGSSLDQRSCMSVPPEYDCIFTSQDVRLVTEDGYTD
jgi:hypothetical protein